MSVGRPKKSKFSSHDRTPLVDVHQKDFIKLVDGLANRIAEGVSILGGDPQPVLRIAHERACQVWQAARGSEKLLDGGEVEKLVIGLLALERPELLLYTGDQRKEFLNRFRGFRSGTRLARFCQAATAQHALACGKPVTEAELAILAGITYTAIWYARQRHVLVGQETPEGWVYSSEEAQAYLAGDARLVAHPKGRVYDGPKGEPSEETLAGFVLSVLRRHGQSTVEDLAQRTGLRTDQVKSACHALQVRGVVIPVGTTFCAIDPKSMNGSS